MIIKGNSLIICYISLNLCGELKCDTRATAHVTWRCFYVEFSRPCLQTRKLAEHLSGNLVNFCNIFKIYLKTIPDNQLRNHKNPNTFKHEKTYLQPLLINIHSHYFLFSKNHLKMKGVYYVRTPSRWGVETGESPPNLGVCLLSPQGATSDTKRVFENCLIVFNHCLPLFVCET